MNRSDIIAILRSYKTGPIEMIHGERTIDPMDFHKIADEIMDLLPGKSSSKTKWKPIEDKTGMKIGSTILVYVSETDDPPRFGGENVFSQRVYSLKGEPVLDSYYENRITHWRPMVKPPKI